MRVVRKRRRYNPKLSSSTIGMINRREVKIARLMLQPQTYLRDILIGRVNKEIALLIETDEKIYNARMERAREESIAKMMARPRMVDLRTREGRALKARRKREAEAYNVGLAQQSKATASLEGVNSAHGREDGARADGSGNSGDRAGHRGTEADGRADRSRVHAETASPSSGETDLDAIRAAIRADAELAGVPLAEHADSALD